jgi:hypothetical protein
MRVRYVQCVGLALLAACPRTESKVTQPTQAPASTTLPPVPAPGSQPAVKAAATSPMPAAGSGALPVRWSEQLKLGALTEIDARLQAPGTTIFGELQSGETLVVPKSCAEWSTLHAQGYEPSTTLEEAPDSAAKRECGTLALLRGAKPAVRSYVRTLRFDKSLLAVLPAACATAQSREQEEGLAEATKKGASLAAFDPKARVKKSEFPGVLEIVEGGKQSSISLEPMAWADFNGDGTEEVLVVLTNQMQHGSASETRLLGLTRDSESEVLRVAEPAK